MIHQHNAHSFPKWKPCLSHLSSRYSAPFHFSSEASLDEDQYSEREAVPVSPSIFRRWTVSVAACVYVCNAEQRLPSAALWMPCLHGNHTYWTDERSTQIRPRWSNGWCQTERERARNLRLRCHVFAPPRAYAINVADGMQRGTHLRGKVATGLKILYCFHDMTVRGKKVGIKSLL